MAFGRLGNNSSDNSNQELAEINMIPLIDVMLVLLIIFMVAAPLSITGIKVELPTSQSKGVEVEEQRTILSIDDKGKFFIDDLNIPPEMLQAKLKAIFQFKDRKELYIRADTKVAYGRVIDAMSAAKIAGVDRMAMLTTPPKVQVKAGPDGLPAKAL